MTFLRWFLGHRLLRRCTTAALCLLAVWILVASNLFVYPSASAGVPARADAVVVLAGASSERLPVGLDLLEQGYAPVLVLSATYTPGNRDTDAICARNLNPRVVCFSPAPMTTRGEARAVARLAKDRGWTDILVVTSRYHVTRAELNLDQCSSANITMVESAPQLGPGQWLGRFVEETGGVAAGLIRPACANPV
ncbi:MULTISPECIES: YdcF family protein [unclassified Arthrobacter]|uniref:YdcF family protein n=1 Tax=unclassified Arthrobacter TaxID=235627 RepID=UPI0024DFF2B7|nr:MULTISPECIES: YdcF family protein [unclassified Arthrobacter]MCC9145750.1 YdcF family protein [Arthrobacter sp. zg-Y919]MDK1276979.1 YdcF family protein [Arthrobacter sp. zg.Y919]WIB04092.1 YdcF family protein [Arthrobacter sp. zg-Y919]